MDERLGSVQYVTDIETTAAEMGFHRAYRSAYEGKTPIAVNRNAACQLDMTTPIPGNRYWDIFVKCSHEYRQECTIMYSEGKRLKTPEGISKKTFRMRGVYDKRG